MRPVCVYHMICSKDNAHLIGRCLALHSVTRCHQNQYRCIATLCGKVGYMLAPDDTSYTSWIMTQYHGVVLPICYEIFWPCICKPCELFLLCIWIQWDQLRSQYRTPSVRRHFMTCWPTPACFARLDTVSRPMVILGYTALVGLLECAIFLSDCSYTHILHINLVHFINFCCPVSWKFAERTTI